MLAKRNVEYHCNFVPKGDSFLFVIWVNKACQLNYLMFITTFPVDFLCRRNFMASFTYKWRGGEIIRDKKILHVRWTRLYLSERHAVVMQGMFKYGCLWWQTSYCTRRSKNNKKCCTKALFLFRKLEMHAVAIIIQDGDNWSRSHLWNEPQEILFKEEVHSYLYNSVSASYGNTKSDCNLASH